MYEEKVSLSLRFFRESSPYRENVFPDGVLKSQVREMINNRNGEERDAVSGMGAAAKAHEK